MKKGLVGAAIFLLLTRALVSVLSVLQTPSYGGGFWWELWTASPFVALLISEFATFVLFRGKRAAHIGRVLSVLGMTASAGLLTAAFNAAFIMLGWTIDYWPAAPTFWFVVAVFCVYCGPTCYRYIGRRSRLGERLSKNGPSSTV
jgi:hypothetical protein